MRELRIVQGLACLGAALITTGLLVMGFVLPHSADQSPVTLAVRDWQGLGADLELHGIGNRIDGAEQMAILDPQALSAPGRQAATYLTRHSPSSDQRLAAATVLANRHDLDVWTVEELVGALIQGHRFDLMPQAVQLAQGLPTDERAPVADSLNTAPVITADANNWQQVLTWAMSIDPTQRVSADLASHLNDVAVALPVGSQALSLLAEARKLDPSNPVIAANWASDSAQLDMAAGNNKDFPTYIGLLRQGQANNLGPNNYSQVIAALNTFQYTPTGWMW